MDLDGTDPPADLSSALDRETDALDGDSGPLIEQIRELQLSADRYHQLAEYANDVLWTMSLDGTVTYISAAVERVRGLTPAEAMAQPLDEVLTPASQVIVGDYFARLHAALQSGGPLPTVRTEQEYYHRDGSIVWFDVLVIPYYNPDGELVELLGVSRDISERKRHALELTRAHAEAEQANRELADQVALLQDFASVAAHDLRGPLATIRMLLDMLAVTAGDRLDATASQFVARATAQTERATQTIDALLDLARSSHPDLVREPVDLAALVDEIIESLHTAEPDDDAVITWGPLPTAIGDKALLGVLMENLLGNSLRYRHPQRRLEVTVTATTEAGWATVHVEDNGRGLHPADIDTLFTAFRRGTQNRDREGLGLGLATCQRIVEGHGGQISAHPLEEGSRFTFSLPVPA